MNANSKLVQVSDVVFTVILIAAAILLWVLLPGGQAGNTVIIKKDGQEMARLPLHENASFEVQGNYTNIISVQDGHVRVVSTNCPGGQCERMGDVSREGASIVCVPNQMSVAISGEEVAVDAITG